MVDTTVSTFIMSSGIANELIALDDSCQDMRRDVRNALVCGSYKGDRVTLLLDRLARAALADYIDENADHPSFYGAERYVATLVKRLRNDPTILTTKRTRNSFDGVTNEMFLRARRKRWHLTYRGAMPAAVVRLVEQVAWELHMPDLPRITWRIADPNGRILSTHDGGASGHITQTGFITITAGPDDEGVRASVLHELAHYYAGWGPGNQHGPEFYRWLLALYRRFRIPAKWVNWEGRTRAVREGERLLRERPVRFPNRGKARPTAGKATPPVRPESTLRRSQRAAASPSRRKAGK